MLSNCVSLLVLLNLIQIGLLPLHFFRRDGAINGAWLATSLPFFLCAALLLLQFTGLTSAWRPVDQFSQIVLASAAIAAASASMLLILRTVRTHRVPLALWHQHNDAPVELVTRGPYARVRHPFYSAFLLTFAAVFLAHPDLLAALCGIYASIALNLTAHREERRLLQSQLGTQYRQYMRHTGRFLPRSPERCNV